MLNTTACKYSLVFLGVCVLALLTPYHAAASNAGETRTPSAIAWAPTFEFQAATIAVSGPAGVTSWTVAKGGQLLIDAASLEGWAKRRGYSVDGSYNFEIRFSGQPNAGTRASQEATPKESSGREHEVAVTMVKMPVLSGHFRVVDGSILTVDPDTAETATAKDIVHADDVITQFSQCIGNDCVDGERLRIRHLEAQGKQPSAPLRRHQRFGEFSRQRLEAHRQFIGQRWSELLRPRGLDRRTQPRGF